jgi:epidermal growth factor receptor substrate 15
MASSQVREMFGRNHPAHHLTSLIGNKAGEIFTKSKLPMDKLAAIWFVYSFFDSSSTFFYLYRDRNLADTQDRGALDQTDFIIGMHLISSIMSGKLSFIPTSLPPGFYDTVVGKPAAPVVAHSTGSGPSFSPTHTGGFATRTPVQPQVTGQALRPQYTGQTLQPQATGYKPTLPARSPMGIPAFPTPQLQWDVTPAEKVSSDAIFNDLDKQRLGYIEGDTAVPFMLQSNLPEDVLAAVW